jgi:hypothetical protein
MLIELNMLDMSIMLHVDLLVQEKRHVSFMYFCTHENINVFISTDRLSFPNNSSNCTYLGMQDSKSQHINYA